MDIVRIRNPYGKFSWGRMRLRFWGAGIVQVNTVPDLYPSAVTDNVNSDMVFATGATTQHPPLCPYPADVSESPAPAYAKDPPNRKLLCKDYFVKDYLVSFLHSELLTFCKEVT